MLASPAARTKGPSRTQETARDAGQTDSQGTVVEVGDGDEDEDAAQVEAKAKREKRKSRITFWVCERQLPRQTQGRAETLSVCDGSWLSVARDGQPIG